jgi:hypothetical protein
MFYFPFFILSVSFLIRPPPLTLFITTLKIRTDVGVPVQQEHGGHDHLWPVRGRRRHHHARRQGPEPEVRIHPQVSAKASDRTELNQKHSKRVIISS